MSEMELAVERMNSTGRARQEAYEASCRALAEVARLTLLKFADEMPELRGLAYETSYEYNDEGGYFRTATVYPLVGDANLGDFDDEFSDELTGFGYEALSTLCGVSIDDEEGQITVEQARERRF